MHNHKPKESMTIEITKEAAHKLIGNDEETCLDYRQDELAETTFYHGNGVNIQVIHNWVGNITQYYVTDINA
jgi:hypothetical protein